MRTGQGGLSCCDRCLGSRAAGAGGPGTAEAIAARRRLKAAVFRAQDAGAAVNREQSDPAKVPSSVAGTTLEVTSARLPRAVCGEIVDVSPQVLVVRSGGTERRLTLTAEAMAWQGTQLEPAALRQGDRVVVRLRPSSQHIADRIWANVGRVTGVIVERSGNTLVVDEGATRKRQVIAIDPRALGRIQVRFPAMEPGYLVDIIGLRRGGELLGTIPATSQPAYPAHRLPAPPLVGGHVPDSISGSATWHEPHDEPPGLLGVAYPALDPETHCAEQAAAAPRHGYARMPYLAIGSVLRIRNDCSGAACLVPVTGCAHVARFFNDRCVTCGTSPRGRIADLSLASFIALGGDLEHGCFNATIAIGG